MPERSVTEDTSHPDTLMDCKLDISLKRPDRLVAPRRSISETSRLVRELQEARTSLTVLISLSERLSDFSDEHLLNMSS